MPKPRQTSRITRPNRDATPGRRRQTQPGQYTRAWDDGDAASRSYLKPPAYASVEEVPADLLERAAGKQGWIARFIREDCPRGMLLSYAAEYAAAMGLTEVPAYTTLVEWVHRSRVVRVGRRATPSDAARNRELLKPPTAARPAC